MSTPPSPSHLDFTRLLTIRILLALVLAGFAGAAQAHPHIFIDAEVDIVFDDEGAVSRLDQRWTFDEAFSAWAVQGLDADGDGVTSTEELQELADENMRGLSQYQFYTYAGEGQENLTFHHLPGQTNSYENGRTTLNFSIAPEQPYRIGRELDLAINDPEYYVAISFAVASKVRLVNAPPGCSMHLEPPREMPAEIADQLYALPPEVTELPPALSAALRGVQGAIILNCAAGAAAAPTTALDAVNEVAQVRPAPPFGGPPPEPGFAMPRTGFLGWIAALQRDFYAALTAALGQLRTDANAFWILGGLSFLYGIVHAAGPGHGKLVIGSYVLANEHLARRGIVLSFASAMVQALVAVGFVLIAVLALDMTSMAMSDATWWITVGSYALVALVGLWLVVRKLFGPGHSHGHAARPVPRDMAAKARAHLHDEGHDHHQHEHHGHEHGDHGHDHDGHEHAHHVVTPDQARGNWREQLGVVLAVGLRPCSGALVVLVFALSQGLLAAGIAATFLMGLGTAITVAVLAAIAVSAKGLARRLMGGESALAGAVVWWLELAGALVVMAFGVVLVLASI